MSGGASVSPEVVGVPPESLVGPRDVARLFNVPTSWVYAQAEAGALPSFKLGKYLRFRPSEIAAWLAERRRGGA